MKISDSHTVIIMVISFIGIMFLLYLIQIIEIKEFLLIAIPTVFISFIFRYSFMKMVDHIRIENHVRRHFKVLTHFLDALIIENKVHIYEVRYMTRYLETFFKDFLMYFGFQKEDITPIRKQEFIFLRGRYRISFQSTTKALLIFYPKIKLVHSDVDIKQIDEPDDYTRLLKELKLYNKTEFNIKL